MFSNETAESPTKAKRSWRSVQLGDLILFAGAIPPTGTTSSELGSLLPMTLSKGVDLKFVVTGGTSSDFTAKVAYAFRVS